MESGMSQGGKDSMLATPQTGPASAGFFFADIPAPSEGAKVAAREGGSTFSPPLAYLSATSRGLGSHSRKMDQPA